MIVRTLRSESVAERTADAPKGRSEGRSTRRFHRSAHRSSIARVPSPRFATWRWGPKQFRQAGPQVGFFCDRRSCGVFARRSSGAPTEVPVVGSGSLAGKDSSIACRELGQRVSLCG